MQLVYTAGDYVYLMWLYLKVYLGPYLEAMIRYSWGDLVCMPLEVQYRGTMLFHAFTWTNHGVVRYGALMWCCTRVLLMFGAAFVDFLIVWSRYNDFLAASLISSQDRVVLHDGILKVNYTAVLLS